MTDEPIEWKPPYGLVGLLDLIEADFRRWNQVAKAKMLEPGELQEPWTYLERKSGEALYACRTLKFAVERREEK